MNPRLPPGYPSGRDVAALSAQGIPSDCRQCGACCFSESPEYVRVTGDDWSRLESRANDLAHFIGNRAFMRMRDGHCAALEMQADEAANGGGRFFCRIYEQRPQACRDLGRGSPQCEGELAAKRDRVAAVVDCPPVAGC